MGRARTMTKKLLMGNEAFAHAALEAGVRVVAGYPGTPSSELIETVAKLHDDGAARGIHVEWSTNEKSALELLAGASYTGARCLFTCKQVGLNVASDALMSLNYVGVKGGMVLFVADDPGPISSQTEQDTRRFASFAKLPVLDPATPDQGFAMMQAAFDLSERYHTPVIVRPTTRINHASTFFDVADATDARPVPDEGFERDPKWVIFPRRAYQAHGEINERLAAIAHDFAVEPALAAFNPMVEGGAQSTEDARTNVSRETFDDGSMPKTATSAGAKAVGIGAGASESAAAAVAPRLGIVAGGVSAAYAREALRMVEARAAAAGVEMPAYRFWQVGTPYPFPEELAATFAEGLDEVLVLEELDHVLEDALLVHAGRTHATYEVRGRLTGDARDRGENDVDDCAARIARFLGIPQVIAPAAGAPSESYSASPVPAQQPVSATAASASSPSEVSSSSSAATSASADKSGTNVSRETFAYDAPADAPLPVRPPVLCAGCPHRGSFYAVKRALGKTPAVLCGDIGCYTLGNAMPLDAVDTCLCMGAGITMAQGFAVAEPHKKTLAFVGDSTFFASGLPGLVNAVYNGHDRLAAASRHRRHAHGAEAPARLHPARVGGRRLRLHRACEPARPRCVGGGRERGARPRRPQRRPVRVAVHPAGEAGRARRRGCRNVHGLQEVHHRDRLSRHRLRRRRARPAQQAAWPGVRRSQPLQRLRPVRSSVPLRRAVDDGTPNRCFT